MQKEMENHDVNNSSILTVHHKKKFRDSSKGLKFIKMRNTLGRHTYGNQVKFSQLKIIFYSSFLNVPNTSFIKFLVKYLYKSIV